MKLGVPDVDEERFLRGRVLLDVLYRLRDDVLFVHNRPNVQIEVASDVRADFALQPGSVAEILTIIEEVPLVNTTSATLGGTLSNKEINDLPLSGRNYENLLQLRPGVTRYPGGGFSTTSSNGLCAEYNAYFVEGLFNSEPYTGQAIINGAGIAGDSATILPIRTLKIST